MNKLIALVLLLIPTLLFAQDCSEFQTGTFYVKDDAGNRVPNYTIERTKKKQIERVGDKFIQCKVVWLSDCSYNLIHQKGDAIDLPKGTVTTIKIIRTFENGFDGLGTSLAKEGTVSFTMYKLK